MASLLSEVSSLVSHMPYTCVSRVCFEARKVASAWLAGPGQASCQPCSDFCQKTLLMEGWGREEERTETCTK